MPWEMSSSASGKARHSCWMDFSSSFLTVVPILIRDLRFDQLRKLRKRVLPAEIAGFRRNHRWDAFLDYAELGADGYGLERDGRLHLSRQIRIIELVGVADALARHELHISAPERVAVTAGEVRE